jgi:hypothetical protein
MQIADGCNQRFINFSCIAASSFRAWSRNEVELFEIRLMSDVRAVKMFIPWD